MQRVLISKFTNKEVLEVTIKNILECEYTLKYREGIALLEIYNSDNEYQPFINNDLLMEYIIMQVPFFDDFMLKIMTYLSSPGLYNSYQVLIKLLIEKKINKEDIPNYFTNLNNEMIDLVKIFVESGLNASKTARILYLHRNTLNYRLQHFNEKIDIDIRDWANANFVYLLIKIIN